MASSLSMACKCHGVSGSCSVKTCWKALPELRVVGLALLKSYYTAVEVGNRRVDKKRKEKKLVPVHDGRSNFTDDELIFYNMSPDYCLPEKDLGSVGTKHRLV